VGFVELLVALLALVSFPEPHRAHDSRGAEAGELAEGVGGFGCC
jgi:hypothetical protein